MKKIPPMLAFAAIAAAAILQSCSADKPNLQREEAAIRKLLGQERAAHFNRDAAQFVMMFRDSMISVKKGTVVKLPREAYREKFQSYFDNVEFQEWDDVVQPTISISDDATLAYAIVQKRVKLLHQGEEVWTEFAWVAIYRKVDGDWKLECNVSTNK